MPVFYPREEGALRGASLGFLENPLYTCIEEAKGSPLSSLSHFIERMDTAIRLRHLVPLLSVFLLGVLRMEAQAQTTDPLLGSMIQAAKTMKTDTIAKTVIEPCLYRVYYSIEYHPIAKTPSPSHEWIQLLQVGETAQRYLDYGSWQADSIFDHGVKAGLRPEDFIPV